jgi:hypothetical protein
MIIANTAATAFTAEGLLQVYNLLYKIGKFLVSGWVMY